MTPDRRVHAERFGLQLVRYNKAGKWYVEADPEGPKNLIPRRQVTLRQAVGIAETWGSEAIKFGVPGGGAFEREWVRASRP